MKRWSPNGILSRIVIDILLNSQCALKLKRELNAARTNEIGGVLVAEQVGDGKFLVIDLSVQRNGSHSHFDRDPTQHREFVMRFHERMGHRPERFNYLGEWHSHPTHPVIPSDVDLRQMQNLVEDMEQKSTFLVLMIVKLGLGGVIQGSVHGFRPNLPPVLGRLYHLKANPAQENLAPAILTQGIEQGKS